MRKFNFCAGPAALPEPVLRQAQQELLDWGGRGCSVMEVSHRSAEFLEVAERAEQDLRDLLSIPDNYKVLFLQGGATAQFSAVPWNLFGVGDKVADYIHSGQWADKAIREAKRYGQVNIVASGEDRGFTYAPGAESWTQSDNAAYFHYTPNETIGGVEFDYVPDVTCPLVADMSSNILSRPIPVEKFGVIYAGAQKNIGPSGIAVGIVRDDLLDRAMEGIPRSLSWKVAAEAGSMDNTPPTFAWYLAGLVFRWLKGQGGVEAMSTLADRKSTLLYEFIDRSDFYSCPVEKSSRSRMNVPFVLADERLDKEFLRQSEEAGLLNLKGHRSVGGMRASLYNAVPLEAVEALVSFMADFEKRCA
ncbi:3-phosphoserine/phosphohydroxythreonine transaminase [Microbulbifer thermotolerans]|uniref:Phosphoserine aminotransferase n=1 Tax=Microbulbifer thermotolerans TaxID=252514 RepID=A0AB35HW98_MICTH|nr:3-phosphoserine/phosphohydroxythreonine transaminase [Microbulbifer thermotolerans]MCX2780010.1 3-phosphoserine/phosphohydroxythreonine transaminase [Microbulbifer thermotolerans]MCX2795134.1 3-phosphoserine/phosphohydroxythreonine transaminase [Microbulbifer thermotolerans]MCX2801837.1 3-phosphoserine/phosphohydroxythreonine transaminase [Microbulbifer thermotolerans]MCX2805433.1 3-phosphoserine/phosphohydroxythreonine transaminase [Microbulbifer thermotolerans]MCX2832040.1 3-phosphoserine